MHEPGGKVGGGKGRRGGADEIEQAKSIFGIVVRRLLRVELLEAITGQLLQILHIAKECQSLKGTDPDVTVAQPRQYSRTGRGGFVSTLERFASLEQREALRRVHAERFKHLCRQHFTNAAFQG